jgi:hypothetical protein
LISNILDIEGTAFHYVQKISLKQSIGRCFFFVKKRRP